MAPSTIKVEIKRQSNPDAPATTYDSNCLEEICGSCAMLINGKATMACSALVDKLTGPNKDQTITLAPLSKFPVVRDLAVDRSVLFENLKKVKAWVPIVGTYDLGPGPKQFPQVQEERYPLSNCISCTICMEVCPQFNDATGFVGAATIAQAKLFNMDPSGAVLKEERLRALAGDGGIQECGFASPKPSPTWAATSSSRRSRTSSPANSVTNTEESRNIYRHKIWVSRLSDNLIVAKVGIRAEAQTAFLSQPQTARAPHSPQRNK